MGSINRFTGFISINLGLVFQKKKTWAFFCCCCCPYAIFFILVVLRQIFMNY